MDEPARFSLPEPVVVPPNTLFRLPLAAEGRPRSDVQLTSEGVCFDADRWFEVLLSVHWDTTDVSGHRFAHTAIPDEHPLHSEAIEATVLHAISGGRQLLRGNTRFGPAGVDTINLEVWHDSPDPVQVRSAALELRPLDATA